MEELSLIYSVCSMFPEFSMVNILKVTPGACLQHVIIEGAVKPEGEREKESQGQEQETTSSHQKGIVIIHDYFHLRMIKDSEKAVPFLLEGLDNTEIRVLSPLPAAGLDKEVTYEKFHQVSHSLGDLVGQYFTGEKPKGQLEIEGILKVGTNITGVGELKLDTDGTLSLRPPSNGSQYFLTPVDFDVIISALAGAAINFWARLRYYRHLEAHREQERKEFNRLLAEAARQQNNVPGQDNLQGVAMCVICLNQPCICVLLDCGHVCCCHTCYQALPQQYCPICRQRIVRVLPLYQV
uniref:RING-type E3 ubiquitin transferase n=1 Tax=Oreochromis niloticus TaxID=8128 RepID=A0A669B9M7_ORENI